MNNPFFQFALPVLLLAGCTTEPVGAGWQRDLSLQTLADKQADANAFDTAIRDLGPVTEPASFWARIANDASYPVERRRRFALELFRRHVRKGMSLAQIAEALDRPTWLTDKNIHKVRLLAGLIPVNLTRGDTVFALIVFPPPRGDQSGVYLRVGGNLHEGELGKLLRGEAGADRIAAVKLKEIGFSEP
jgi:hypothetical protein